MDWKWFSGYFISFSIGKNVRISRCLKSYTQKDTFAKEKEQQMGQYEVRLKEHINVGDNR